MIVKRRLIFWLIKAYVQKWGKAIFAFFVLGLVIFFFLQAFLFSFITKITSENKETVGVIGSYSVDSLPSSILEKVSQGLTSVGSNDTIQPALATSWEVKDNGKTYVFHLKKGISFSDGKAFTSFDVPYSFANVKVSRPDQYTIIFHLKEPYAPFLVTVSQPIFKGSFVGIGDYIVKNISLNDSFVQSLTLSQVNNSGNSITYQFYPTESALKLAFALGEISRAEGLSSLDFQETSFANFPNTTSSKSIDYSTLVTLFFNTADKDLSDKRVRDALSYAIPNTFSEGLRAYTPISPLSWAYANDNPHLQDFTHARLLMEAADGTNTNNYPKVTITTLAKYEHIATTIQQSWQKIGITATIKVVDSIPSSFQIYLGDFHLPQDPDQYTLWHSYEQNNITNFNNDLRTDKLLEDGRKTIDQATRAKIYADFQKYIADEEPAIFLYFPYSFNLARK